MNLSFDLNDYLLIWNLLFLPSVTNDVQRLKEKLWKNYRHLYKDLYKEEAKILKDPKNYIPMILSLIWLKKQKLIRE